MSAYGTQRDTARRTIADALSGHWSVDARGRQYPESESSQVARSNLAIAESLLAVAEALRPAPVEVEVTVTKEQIAQSVRDAMEDS
jgi:hypothetical protein